MLSAVARKESRPSRSPCGPALFISSPKTLPPPPISLPLPTARSKSSPPIVHFRRGIERQPAIHKNGWFVTATRIFQRAEGCAVLLSVVARKESPPSRYLCDSALFTPSPKTPPLPPISLPLPTARGPSPFPPYTPEAASNENPLSIRINGWFVTAALMFQRAEGCAVLLLNAIGLGEERVPAVSLSL